MIVGVDPAAVSSASALGNGQGGPPPDGAMQAAAAEEVSLVPGEITIR